MGRRWAAARRRHDHDARIDDAVGSDGIVALPTLDVQDWGPVGPIPASAGSALNNPAVATDTPDLNATGQPAVSVPMGLGGACRWVSKSWRHAGARGLALGVAEVLERVRPWPLVAPGHERLGLT